MRGVYFAKIATPENHAWESSPNQVHDSRYEGKSGYSVHLINIGIKVCVEASGFQTLRPRPWSAVGPFIMAFPTP
jgi:hypothetical protein